MNAAGAAHEAAARQRWLGPALCLVAVACVVPAWYSTGTGWEVIGWWIIVVALGVLAPGWALVRLTRRRGGPTDLAWAFPAGLLVTLAVWTVGRLSDIHLSSPVVGAVLAVALLLIGAHRDRRRSRHDEQLGTLTLAATVGVLAGVGAAMAIATRWMWHSGLVLVPPVPDPAFPTYDQDLVFHTALTGELRRNLVPGYPMVNGEPLSYHWFFHAVAAQLGGNGFHDFDVVMRLLPTTLVIGLVGLAAAVGYQVTGHAAGAVGSALGVAVVTPLGGDPWPTFPRLDIMRTYWQLSPTATLGWVFGLALTGIAIAMVRRGASDRIVPTPLLAPLALAAVGAKSSQVPVVLAGLGLAAVAWAVLARRRRTWWTVIWRYALVGTVLAAATVVGVKILYPASYGLRLSPLEGVEESVVVMLGETRTFDSAITGGLGVYLLRQWGVLLLCSLGTVWLIRRRPLDPSGWIGVGALLSALGAVLLLKHPGSSQWYFLVAAFPIVMSLSGAGLADACRTAITSGRRATSVQPGTRALVVPLTVAAGVGVGFFVRRRYADETKPIEALAADARTRELLLAWATPAALLVAALAAVGLLGWLAVRRGRSHRASRGFLPALMGLAAVSAGLVALVPILTSGRPGPADLQARIQWHEDQKRPPITRALFDAGAHLRREAAPTDIVATNRVINATTRGGARDNRDFAVPAVSGLRTDVAGFGYAPRMLDRGPDDSYYAVAPFWDPARLAAEQALITDPTPATLAAAYENNGIRWVLADERSGPVSPALANLTATVLVEDGVHLYRLRPPPS